MEDKELYQHILGLQSPWTVKEVTLDTQSEQINIHVHHPGGTKFCCPECQTSLACYDHVAERQWRHLDSCQYKTILHASVPRVKCPEHGVIQVAVPWAEKNSRFTLLFERLARTKYIWLTGQENLSEKQQLRLDEVFDLQLQTGMARAYKEMLRDLWRHDTAAEATIYFNDWYRRVIHTKLAPMKKVARTIKERLLNVVSYCTHQITNVVAEGMNSKIMSIKRRVGGYRNPENFKSAIYFYCGGLDLYPH